MQDSWKGTWQTSKAFFDWLFIFTGEIDPRIFVIDFTCSTNLCPNEDLSCSAVSAGEPRFLLCPLCAGNQFALEVGAIGAGFCH
jgi:hypothetical protein